jgi:acetyl-CoA acetyltransferase
VMLAAQAIRDGDSEIVIASGMGVALTVER